MWNKLNTEIKIQFNLLTFAKTIFEKYSGVRILYNASNFLFSSKNLVY